MPRHATARAGFVLAAALVAVAIIGALIGVVSFASRQEYQLGRSALLQARAFGNAEEGLNDTYARWDNADNVRMAVGDTRVFATPTARVTVTRTTPATFWAVSEGWVTEGSVIRASRRTGMLWILDVPRLPTLAALTVRGPLAAGDGVTISGSDTPGPGWTCDGFAPALPGLLVERLGDVTTTGLPTIVGNPGVDDSAVVGDTATFFRYGETSWDELAASASVILPSGASLSPAPRMTGSPLRCDTAEPFNWGDAGRSASPGICESHFPLIHASGDLHVDGGGGQGVLLVEGNLRVTGSFTFHGPVIVRGTLQVDGAEARLVGSVMVANARGGRSVVAGSASIIHSSCAIATALRGATPPTAAPERAWAELF